MAKFPQWTATVDPAAGGPLIVRQPNAGQTGMAMAQLGSTIAGVGSYLTAEARQAAERTAELDRIRQTSTITRQATSELRKFSDEIRRDPNPANYERRFDEVSSSILAGLDAIEDPEVRARAQMKIDSELDFHQRDMLTWRMQAQQKAFEREYVQAEQDAIRTGNVESVEMPLQALVDAGFTTPEQAARARSVVEAKTIVWQTALTKGWTEGLKYATDPDTLASLPLSPEERAAFKRELESYIASEKTLEQLSARKEAERIEADRRRLFADAFGEKLTDPEQIDRALRAGVLSPAEAKQLYELMKKGPAVENDPDVFREAVQRIKAAQADPGKVEAVAAWLRGHAASSLRAATYETFINQLYKPDDPLNLPAVKLLSGLIDESYEQGAFGDWGTLDAQMSYARAKQAFMTYAQSNPEATDEQLNTEYRRLVEPEARPRWYARIRDVFLRTGTGLAGLYGEPVGVEPITFEQADASRPPETLEQFERVLMSLPPGSKAQEDYYRKWADKWR